MPHGRPSVHAGGRIKGTVDVCTTGLGRSWTRGLERRANKRFHQHVEVHRRGEDHLRGCDIVVWLGGRVALDYVAGMPAANPRYDVYTGPYAIAKAEVNVGSSTPRKARVRTLLRRAEGCWRPLSSTAAHL